VRNAAEDWFRQLEASNAVGDSRSLYESARLLLPVCFATQGIYLASLAAAVKDASKPDDHRQLAGIMIKNGLDAEVRFLVSGVFSVLPDPINSRCTPSVQNEVAKDRLWSRWMAQPEPLRNSVKQDVGCNWVGSRPVACAGRLLNLGPCSLSLPLQLLLALHSPGDLARLGAAQSIAKIANIELRKPGGWPEVLPRLLRSCVDAAGDVSVRSSAYRCLAYILEDLVRHI
jgi:hypothetical protein